MPDKAWKNRERLVSKFFGGIRNALSGINSKVTHADVIHKELFIECKLRAKHSAVKLWDDTKVYADKEKKYPSSHYVRKIDRVFGLWFIRMILNQFQK